MRKTWLCLAVCWSGLSAAAPGAEVFRNSSFEEALKAAEKDNKVVFVDFYAAWCPPCIMLEQTTWKDKEVGQWLSERAVALKIDAEKQKDLAQKYKVMVYPTLLFLRADGTEIERRLGYIDAGKFLDVAEGVQAGKTVLDRLEEQLKADPDDPMLRFERGVELSDKARFDEAWKELLWCLDNGAEGHPEFVPLRDGRVLDAAVELAKMHPPANDTLLVRREEAEKRIREGKGSTLDCRLYVEVSATAFELDRVMETYQEVAKQSADMHKLLYPAVFNMLLSGEVFEELSRHGRIPEMADTVFQNLDSVMKLIDAGKFGLVSRNPRARAALKESEKQFSAALACEYYEALLALGKVEPAAALAKRILELDSGVQTLNMVAWAGYMSGKPVQDNIDQARRALELSNGNISVLDTLVRIMDRMGQTDQALKMCEDALKKADADRDKEILNMCIEEFKEAQAAKKEQQKEQAPSEGKGKAGEQEKDKAKGPEKAKEGGKDQPAEKGKKK